jgi:hypothetical protein
VAEVVVEPLVILEALPALPAPEVLSNPHDIPASVVNPVARRILDMLSQPRGAQTAMLLHEVFAGPVCRREKRGRGPLF